MQAESPVPEAEAPRDCPLCPRLVRLREEMRAEHPGWWNAPVPAFGDSEAWLAIVGLAPGMKGANRTGRPFTGDDAGTLLFKTLAKFGLTQGDYSANPDDGLRPVGCVILNAVKCLPPQNKPQPGEIAACRPFLAGSFQGLPKVTVVVALGGDAHDTIVASAGCKRSTFRFRHLAEHRLPDGRALIDSYHCSRRNQNTRLLTVEMFEAVFEKAIGLRR